MTCRTLSVHPSHPQQRLLRQAADVLARGGVVACPTDACYSLVCMVGNKAAEDRVRAIRHLAADHPFTLMCRDESELAQYAKLSNTAFRFVRSLTPGPYTFILPARKETPRRLQDPKRRQIGVRISAHPCISGLGNALESPLLSTTLIDDAVEMPYADAADIVRDLGHAIDVCIESDAPGVEMTTVIDLSGDQPRLVRAGRGDVSNVMEFA